MLARQWHDFRLANSPISFRGTLPETYKHKECRDTVRKLSRQRLESNAHALPVGRQCAAAVFFGGSRVAMARRFRKTCPRSSNVNIKNHAIAEEGLDAYYQEEVARRICSCNCTAELFARHTVYCPRHPRTSAWGSSHHTSQCGNLPNSNTRCGLLETPCINILHAIWNHDIGCYAVFF